jgi:CDP-paratose 2-epimerase
VSVAGVSEQFALDGPRSYYGASKLAAELLCQEYAANAGLPVVINRCGVIAGPGQFGTTDQGVFTFWIARHYYGRALKYTGFGGTGCQVRDLLHPDDLSSLVHRQLDSWDLVAGRTFNVGGGRQGAVSLREFTGICQEVIGREVLIEGDSATSPVDVPWYITDHELVSRVLGWTPSRVPREIVADVQKWIRANEQALSMLIV